MSAELLLEIGTEEIPSGYLNDSLEALLHLAEACFKEKMIRVSDTMRIYLMVDCFNVLNKAIEQWRWPYNYGTYYVHNDTFVPGATTGLLYKVLNPRIFRFGIRFQF